MSESRYSPVRLDPRLRRLIDADRGDSTFSAWVRESCARRLEDKRGLGPEFRDDLIAYSAQLRGIGINLNQLARAANERRPVVVNDRLLTDLRRDIAASRELLARVLAALLE